MQLSEKLRLLSVRFALTQEQLGADLGIAHTTVGRWLAGKSRPYDRHALKLAQMFGVDYDVLIDDTKELPEELLREPGGMIREAKERAQAMFPDDLKAGQQAFLAKLNEDHWRYTSLDTARALNKQAEQLLALAEGLVMPFLSSRDTESRAIREKIDELKSRAAEDPAAYGKKERRRA